MKIFDMVMSIFCLVAAGYSLMVVKDVSQGLFYAALYLGFKIDALAE